MPPAGPGPGFTLVELLTAVAIVAVVAAIAVPGYRSYVEGSRTTQTEAEIFDLQILIDRAAYSHANPRYPDTLADIGGAPLDPWGNPYQYLNIRDLAPPKGKLRKDKNLVPINTDYDLYSMGPDGASVAPLTAKASRDDIVRANDGRYIGTAESY